jgi:hypothetical protein
MKNVCRYPETPVREARSSKGTWKTVKMRRERSVTPYHRMLGDLGFVNKKDYQTNESKDEGRENASGRPRVLGASPRQPDDNGRGSRNHEDIAAVVFSVRNALKYNVESHIQSTRASFSRAVPGGVGTRRHVKMRDAAAPQIGMLRSMQCICD